jgi:hypothetical protein
VSTADASCTPTSFQVLQDGVGTFGMGFSTIAPGLTGEKLFICDLGGKGLGMIDLPTLTVSLFGQLDGTLAGKGCELTGTGDARLFGFFTGNNFSTNVASVAEIDRQNVKAVSNVTMTGVDTGTDWAFSFWGGDFWLYTADRYNANQPMSSVTRYRPSDGSVTQVLPNIGMRIVGAGVSTCAPVTPVLN